MKSKKEMFLQLWVPVEKRLPPDKLSWWVLGWNPKMGCALYYPARGVRNGVKKRLDGIPPSEPFQKENSSGYWITHWLRILPPEGMTDKGIWR